MLRLSARYIWITTLAMAPFFGLIVIGAVFRGLGDTVTPMRIMIGVNTVAVVFDYALILGAGPFPRLGVVGAAISGDIARVVGFVASVWFLSRGPLKGALRGPMVPSWSWFLRILRIGMPTALQTFLRTGAGMTFVSVLGRLPDASAAVAALTIGMRTEAISFMPGLAFGMAAGSMVGQNLGARQPGRAEESGWVCVRQALCIMVPVAVGFYVFARPVASLFAQDPRVIALTVGYLKANAVGQPALAFGMVLSGALQGAGETKVPAWVTLASMWGVRLPTAYVVAVIMGLGASGAWWTMTVSSIVYGLIIVAIYSRGKWKNKQV
ncbi:MAG: MATE family efflux transporter [Armatimonadota bacterium]